MTLWPNKVIELDNPADDLIPEVMADIHPSIWQAQTMIISLAERRVGVNEMSQQGGGSMGSRTPGITALSMIQQFNKRFTPAFGSMRKAFSAAVKQALYRYQEKVLAGRSKVLAHIVAILGIEDGYRVIGLLKSEEFDEGIVVELTAASSSVNKEAERQATFQLVGILSQYYSKTLELVTIAANPQTPPAIAEVAKQIAEAAGEIIERTIRTFDQVRDPALFMIEVEEAIDQATADRPRQAVLQLLGGMKKDGIVGGGGGSPEGGIDQPAQGGGGF
jgi:predicted transcriptional regulator